MEKLKNYCEEKSCENRDIAIIYSPSQYFLRFDLAVKDKICFDKFNNEYKIFYGLLWDSYLNGDTYWFQEKQYCEGFDYSGIHIDIDAYSSNSDRIIDVMHSKKLIKLLLNIIKKYLEIEDVSSIKIYILMNPQPYKVNELFKEGIHIVIPSIKLRKEVKAFIYDKFKEVINKFFVEKGFNDNAMDDYCKFNPIQIYGSLRTGKEFTHKIKYVFSATLGDKITLSLDNENTYSYHKKTKESNSYFNINLALELSIHYKGIVEKYDVDAREEIKGEISTNYISINKIGESDEKKIERDVDILTQQDYRALEVKNYIDILNPARGKKGNTKEWTYVVKVILNININYGCLAKYFSIKADRDCWIENGIEGYNKIYEDVLSNSRKIIDGINNSMKYLNILRSFAREDSPAEYEMTVKETLEQKIFQIFSKKTIITDTLLANLIKDIIGSRYKYVEVDCKGFQSNGFWYEYIINPDGERRLTPFKFKWYKHSSFPKSIDKVISKELSSIIRSAHQKVLNKLYESAGDKEKKKIYSAISKEMETTVKRCENDVGISSIKKRCQDSSFYDKDFEFDLDTCENALGVGNGVLLLNKDSVKLIDTINNYKLSRTTDTPYIPYDKNDKYIKIVEGIIRDIIPDDNKRKGMLIHMSRALVKFGTMRLFTIWQSGGSSGKSVLMNLANNALGQVGGTYGNNFGYFNLINPRIFCTEKKDINSPDNHYIQLEHLRLIHCSEATNAKIIPETFKSARDGYQVRGLFESNKLIKIEGIIFYVTNNSCDFKSYNLALQRRIIYMYFTSVFVDSPDPEKPYQKKKNENIEIIASNNKNYGIAFLSILVQHFLMLNEYKSIDDMYEKTGLAEETAQFINNRNKMMKYINENVLFTKEPTDIITILDFCSKYAIWYKELMHQDHIIAPSSYEAEARNNLSDYIKDENFVGIKLKDIIN